MSQIGVNSDGDKQFNTSQIIRKIYGMQTYATTQRAVYMKPQLKVSIEFTNCKVTD